MAWPTGGSPAPTINSGSIVCATLAGRASPCGRKEVRSLLRLHDPQELGQPPQPPSLWGCRPGVAAIAERVTVGVAAAADHHRAGALQPQLTEEPAAAEVSAITEPAMATSTAVAELMHAGWQLQGNRTRRWRNRFSHGIHSHSRRGRAHHWGAPCRRPRCRTTGGRCGMVFPVGQCNCIQGKRTEAWWVSPGSWSWSLLAQGS